MSESMVQRVAWAIACADATIMHGVNRSQQSPQQSPDPKALARAAIKAMREPSEAMMDATTNPDEAAMYWQQMIDAALTEAAG